MRVKRAGLLLLLFLAAVPALRADASSPFFLSARVYWADEHGTRWNAVPDLFGVGTAWRKEGEDLIFTGEAKAGERKELMQGVVIPADWGNEMAGEKISLVIEAAVQQDLAASGIQSTRICPVIEEFQKNSLGEEEPYVNGKCVLPGEKVSKIVRIRLVKEGASASAGAKAGAKGEGISSAGVKNTVQESVFPDRQTDAVIIPIGSSGKIKHLPSSDGSLPSVQKSTASPAGHNPKASGFRSAQTSDSLDPLRYAAGILAGLILLVLWLWTVRRRNS